MRPPSSPILLLAGLTLATLTGCGTLQTLSSSAPSLQSAHLTGAVHGGQQPVSGSRIYLYAASANGYGAASISLLTAPNANVQTDTAGNNYVTTDAGGNFTITSDFTCPAAISLLAALGPCNALTTSTRAFISELSTAAAITTLQQFLLDPTHLGTSSTNAAGLANAFASVPNLVDLPTSIARATNLTGTGVAPQSKLNTLADILAPCINSPGPTSTACANLFAAATPTSGTAPSDVASAMLAIARNPGTHVPALYALIDSNAPFQPTLTSAPNDLTLAITYTGGGLLTPGDIVLDSVGNIYAANCPHCPTGPGTGTDSIVGFGPQGALLTGPTGFTANIHLPQGLAIDPENDIWSTNLSYGSSPDQVTRLFSTGTIVTGFPYAGAALGNPLGIAIDSSSNAWVTNQTLNNAIKITPAGVLAVNNVTSTNFSAPLGIGIDGQGYIFAAGSGSSSILKFDPSGNILSGSGSGFTGGGLSSPIGISIDSADHIFSLNNQTNAVSEILGTTGAPIAPARGYPGGYQVAVLAIDGAGTLWFANCKAGCPGSGGTGPDNITHLDANGNLLNTANGYQDPHLNGVGVAAIDFSGNLWVSNSAGASLTQLLGIAAPVLTPIATAALNNKLGTRP